MSKKIYVNLLLCLKKITLSLKSYYVKKQGKEKNYEKNM